MDNKVFTVAELREFDGKKGRKAYVSYRGKVYDVSASSLWKEGDHQSWHVAGRDLTDSMNDAPHGEENLAPFPVVGELSVE